MNAEIHMPRRQQIYVHSQAVTFRQFDSGYNGYSGIKNSGASLFRVGIERGDARHSDRDRGRPTLGASRRNGSSVVSLTVVGKHHWRRDLRLAHIPDQESHAS